MLHGMRNEDEDERKDRNMERKYTIRVESHNPEFDVPETLQKGIQVDGFVLLTTLDGDPAAECMNGMNTIELAKFFCTDNEVCSILQQAAAIGEGMRKAEKIKAEVERKSGGLDAILQIIAKRKKQELDDLK
jgi:hypothetical protein